MRRDAAPLFAFSVSSARASKILGPSLADAVIVQFCQGNVKQHLVVIFGRSTEAPSGAPWYPPPSQAHGRPIAISWQTRRPPVGEYYKPMECPSPDPWATGLYTYERPVCTPMANTIALMRFYGSPIRFNGRYPVGGSWTSVMIPWWTGG